MKFLFLGLLFSSFALANPEIILSPVEHLYIPEGFDSNDSVEVVVTGSFPSACYSRNNVEVKVQHDIVDITITAIAPDSSFVASSMCPDMIVPYKEVVTIGNLQGGNYQVRVNHQAPNSLRDKMMINEANSRSVDDHIYGAIEWIEQKGQNDYVLHGWRYSYCIDLKEIKIVTNNKDTLSILPIMKQTAQVCPMKGMPVAYPVKLDFSSLKMKQPLLHVRTMDGKSVNSIVNLAK